LSVRPRDMQEIALGRANYRLAVGHALAPTRFERSLSIVKGSTRPDLYSAYAPARCALPARLALVLLCGLSISAPLAGCSTTGNHASEGGGAAAPATSANTLRQPLTTEPTTLDPALVEDGTTIDLLQNIFEGLVTWDENNRIAPNLAEKWEVSPDGTVYTFHLKHGVKFHQNGREVKAADFKYSIERACDPQMKSQTASTYLKDIVGVTDRIYKNAAEVSGIKAIDDYTLQITIDAFKPYWLGNMTYPTGFVVCREEVEKNGGKVDEKSAIGTGPFILSEFRRGYQVTLTANPGYHRGRPKLDAIVRPILKDATTRLNKYEAGELDIVDVAPSDLEHVHGDPKLSGDLKAFPRAAIWYLALNQAAANSPFTKKEVRRAFAMAIDKAQIVRVALHDQAEVANGIVPPGVLGYNPDVTPLPFNPARAKVLLAQAGYPNGQGFPRLSLTFRQDMPQVSETAEVVRQQLKSNLGVEVQLSAMEWGTFLKERTARTMPFAHLRWAADYLDPQDFLSVLLHTSKKVGDQDDHPENGVGYSNSEFDRLCDTADVEHDPNKRIKEYRDAEQMAVNDAPWVPLYFQKDLELVKPRVGHLRDSLFGHLPHITTTVGP
jgi:oligopeptide transport system substrate-binding protein